MSSKLAAKVLLEIDGSEITSLRPSAVKTISNL